ncbi:hypothetical protein GEMRC1_005732 [Eukaryota sp. GEM-RC1]
MKVELSRCTSTVAFKETIELLQSICPSNKNQVFSNIVNIFIGRHSCSRSFSNEDLEKFRRNTGSYLLDKAYLEPTLIEIYFALCLKLPEQFDGFFNILIEQCHSHFQKKFDVTIPPESCVHRYQTGVVNSSTSERRLEMRRHKAKVRACVLASIQFVTSIFLHSTSSPTKHLVQPFQISLTSKMKSLVTVWTKLFALAEVYQHFELIVAKFITSSRHIIK